MNERKSSKENASSLFKRYVWLVDTIYRMERITFEEINEKWVRSSLNASGENFPTRTFHNHRKAIEEMFDINIECDKKAGYLYYVENGEEMEHGGVRSWLLNTFAVNNLINESHKLKQRILFERIPSGQMYLSPIIEAMRDGLSVEISYQNYGDTVPHTFEVYPYCVKVFRQRWYVVAYSLYREALRIYALDRIKSLTTTDHFFQLPQDFDGESYFADYYGITVYEDSPLEKVRIKAKPQQACYIRALPLHCTQTEERQTEEYSIFSYNLRPTYDFQQELLSRGCEVEVLSPGWLRDEIAEIVREQNRVYWG